MAPWFRKLRTVSVLALLTSVSLTIPLSACSANSDAPNQHKVQQQKQQQQAQKPPQTQAQTKPQHVSDLLPLPVKIQQPTPPAKPQPTYRSQKVDTAQDGTKLIRVPAIHQHPGLPTGCEVTSLAMLLQAMGKPVDKMRLSKQMHHDPTPIRYDAAGKIAFWGNPSVGFVGKMDGSAKGFGVYHGPVASLLNQHLPNMADDMTGQPFDAVLEKIDLGKPVVVWTTVPLQPTNLWSGWNTNQGPIRMTWNEHAVLLVGYGPKTVYINDPFDGTAAKRVDRNTFEKSWIQLGKQAVSVK